MPQKYRVELSDGRKFEVEADGPPNEDDVLQALGGGHSPAPAAAPAPAAPVAAAAAPTSSGHLTDYLPQAGGLVGGMLGGAGGAAFGLGFGGVPGAIGGAALGGAGGEAAKELIDRFIYGKETPATPLAAAGQIAKNAAIEGGSEAIGAGVGNVMQRGARRFYSAVLKPADALVKSTNTFREGATTGFQAGTRAGSKVGGQREIADTLLKHNIPLSENGWERGMGIMDGLSDQVSRELKGSGAMVPGNAATAPLEAKIAEIRGAGTAALDSSAAAAPYQKLLDAIKSNIGLTTTTRTPGNFARNIAPTSETVLNDIPADQAYKLVQEGRKHAVGTWGVPSIDDTAEAYKMATSGLRRAVGSAVPEIEAPLRAESELIPALNTLNTGMRRITNSNGISLTDKLMLGTGVGAMGTGQNDKLPYLAAISALSRPSIGGFVARRAYKAAPFAPAAAHGISALVQRVMREENEK